jgi:hypothetical protein
VTNGQGQIEKVSSKILHLKVLQPVHPGRGPGPIQSLQEIQVLLLPRAILVDPGLALVRAVIRLVVQSRLWLYGRCRDPDRDRDQDRYPELDQGQDQNPKTQIRPFMVPCYRQI